MAPSLSTNQVKKLAKSSYAKTKTRRNIYEKNEFTPVSRLSNHDTHVVLDKYQNPVIVHRGSKTVGDWLTDGAIALGFGKYTSRYKNAKKITKKVEKEYGKKAIHVGHSLGGYLAENAASKNAEVHTINKHAVGFTGNVKNKNQYDYRKAGDLASLPSIFQTNNGKKRVQFGEFSINPLKSHEFNNL